MDSEDYDPKVNVVMQESDEEDNEVLPPRD
jgi:hypothetical protein